MSGETSNQPIVSVIVPAFNEVRTISGLLGRLRAVACVGQTIAIDDSSVDGTDESLRGWSEAGGRIAIFHPITDRCAKNVPPNQL